MAALMTGRVNPKQFGVRLKLLREAAGLTQAELAQRTKIKKQSISSWESGHRTPDFITVLKMAAVLGKSPDDFAVIPDDVPAHPKMGRPTKPKGEETPE